LRFTVGRESTIWSEFIEVAFMTFSGGSSTSSGTSVSPWAGLLDELGERSIFNRLWKENVLSPSRVCAMVFERKKGSRYISRIEKGGG
jgi:hypothetical protein